jgi:hypothetical protein
VGKPVHVPWEHVSVESTDVKPDIAGGSDGILTGGAGAEAGAEAGAVGTIALLLDATREPFLLIAVTRYVIDCPTSSFCIVYVELVAPEIGKAPLYH